MQQITRGDYLKDLITIYVDNNLQTSLTDLYSQFVFQCGDIQKFLTPAQVIKISFSEQESQLLNNYNTCYLAGITVDGHKETFNGSLTFNTRGEVVFYEPPVSTVIPAATETTCDCQGLRGFFSNCTQPAIKAYFSLNYVPTKLSELTNDTDYQDGLQVAESISIHNASTEAHPYIQSLIATETEALETAISNEAGLREQADNTLQANVDAETSLRVAATEALQGSINAETTAREQAVSLAISTTEAYADNSVSVHNSSTSAHTYIQGLISSETTNRENADNNLQTQIDGLAAASDVTDIVGTYAELQAYDTQHLNDNDIIKVLSDSTHEDEPSYYRFDKDTDTFSYIGSESAAYTKAQADSIFVTQTTEINGYALSSDINLTASDVGALSDTTTINDLTNTAQQNALNSGVTSSVVSQVSTNTSAIAANTSAIASNTSVIAQHTTAIASNTSDISTINGKIPTDASTSNKLVSASTLAASIADFANQDLSNLTENGEARLHALKSYADKGELLTDPDGLAFVESYAHSTFDRSKFTVVGSPNITDDGIASFSRNNYITIPKVDFGTANTWKIQIKIKTPSALPIQYSGPIFAYTYNSYFGGVQIIFLSEGNLIFIGGSASNQAEDIFYINFTPSLNTEYLLSLEFTGTQYIAKYSLDEENWVTINTVTSSTKVTSLPSDIKLGQRLDFLSEPAAEFFTGTIVLKQFSITADGVEVFSGNKTGIDTIKPDDYTVEGSPTISADGIASGFSTSNYLTSTNLTISSSETTTIKLKYNIPSSTTHPNFIWCMGNDYRTKPAFFVNNEQCSLFLNSSTGLITLSHSFSGEYDFICEFDKTMARIYYKQANENEYTFAGQADLPSTFSLTDIINIGTERTGLGFSCEGSIDLNAFKIYVDGNLVYQPCLKIPYTESKTGSKVVNAIYRDRVNDMATQFGYANYYTLSDTDFTLPQVELYGLIGHRTLRDSYRNGINYWELYSNRDLEQGGSCTSGVEVTFARPFADTNYVLSVPYSAKSSTAFTPTQTGDWIAKGKGIL